MLWDFFNQNLDSLTLLDLLQSRAKSQSNKEAYIFLLDGEKQESCLTYGELDLKARSIAAWLQSHVSAGERALLLYPSGLEFIAAFFGCLYAGIIAVPTYPPGRNQKMSRLKAILGDSEAKVALTTTAELAKIEGRLSQKPKLAALHWLATDNIASDLALNWQEPKVSEDTLAFLQYTSGSTGNPKGVMVSHGNLLHNSHLIHNCFDHSPNSQGVIWLPPYHDMGLIGGVLQPLYGGFPVTLMSPISFLKKPLRWLQAISRYQATTSGGPDFAYDLACRRITPEQCSSLDLGSWEVAFSGAEPIRAQTLERFANYFSPCGFRREAFYPCYGMAETTLIISGGLKTEPPIVRYLKAGELEKNRVVSATEEEEGIRSIVGCGQSWLNQKIVIVDPQSLTVCEPDQVGEVWVSGLSVAQGYWQQPEQTKQTFHSYLADTGEGPFLRTGDLGFLQDGELFITGRIKDLMIIQGRNHYPQDIEITVEQSHSSLRPSSGAAFTIEFAEQEKLVIAHEVERSYLRQLNPNEVIGAIRRAVAEQHDLQAYAVLLLKIGGIPKTSSGKVQRRACRERFLSGSLDLVADWSADPRSTAKFRHLEAEVESLFCQLQTGKQQKNWPKLEINQIVIK
jgi:acyl-CoA synthetase (AMP-forming)/AMP-acid ligase II